MSRTVVSFHAHPDDEALLTGGTLAAAAAAGHRVVLVVATGGEHGLARETDPDQLALARSRELRHAAAALGCERTVSLGYPDSGMNNEHRGFASVTVEDAARRLAAILVEERADVLTIYDANGGYGHPDHRQVHAVGRRAAELASTPVVLEATVDRTALLRLVTTLARLRLPIARSWATTLAGAYVPRSEITHCIDVRAQLPVKRAAMAAHTSQRGGGRDVRTLELLLRLPAPVFRRVCGREWFVQSGSDPVGPLRTDIFSTLPGSR